MYSKSTVFVIGAGCSHEFGLPLGTTLRDEIYNAVQRGSALYDLIGESVARYPIVGSHIDVSRRLEVFARGLHGKASIDQYLDFHRHDALFVALGKIAIATVILTKERDSSLRADSVKQGLVNSADTWLTKLFHAMSAGTSIATIGEMFRNVSFVCFNYDRCIEVALFNALKSTANLSNEKVAAFMSGLRIWHPYGTVGALDKQNFTGRNVLTGFPDRAVDYQDVIAGAQLLRTFTEGADNDEMLAAMRDALSSAQQVVYLGFSYLDQNMALLRAPTHHPNSLVYATAYGLSDADIELAEWAIAAASAPERMPPGQRKARVKMSLKRASTFFADFGNTIAR